MIPGDRTSQAHFIQSSNERTLRAAKNLMGDAFEGKFPLRLRCECGQLQCEELIEVPSEMSWSQVLWAPLFLVAPNHLPSECDVIVKKSPTYCLVKLA
jgi:hypothetical protein